MPAFTTARPSETHILAPDGSEIRPLVELSGGSFAHCTLPPQSVSRAVAHHTIEEIWFFLEGHGQVWRRQGEREEVLAVEPGLCLTIPLGTHFQFRNPGPDPLRFVIATLPPWPGEQEAYPVEGYWPISQRENGCSLKETR